jgi:peptidoglycan/LPS O-acetylase OafA/YrhL
MRPAVLPLLTEESDMRTLTTNRALPFARLCFLDGLRGIAAVWVAGFHFYGGLSDHFTSRAFVEPVHTLLRHGNSGVEIFFVLSGFVIAYSLRQARIDAPYCMNFVVRRAIRLDPPYWCTIVLACLVMMIANVLRTDRIQVLPSLSQVAAHLVYLQNFAGVGNIVDVFWTLCIEVQFYLTFLLLTAVSQRWRGPRSSDAIDLLVFGPVALWSIATRWCHAPGLHPAFMIKFWYLFQLGVLACWTLTGAKRPAYFWAYTGLLLVAEWRAFHIESSIGIGTGVMIYLVGTAHRLETWLSAALLQFFGRISYSLYLVHAVVGTPFTYYLARQWVTPEGPVWAAFGLFVAAFVVSTITAYLLYRLVEHPSVTLSRRIKSISMRDVFARLGRLAGKRTLHEGGLRSLWPLSGR